MNPVKPADEIEAQQDPNETLTVSNRTTAHPPSIHHKPTRPSTNATIANSHLDSNNSTDPIIDLQIPKIKGDQHIQRSLQRSLFILRALIPITLDSVDKFTQFHQFQEIFLQSCSSWVF
jgi:hypothetical protein